VCGLCGVLGPETHWSDASGDLKQFGEGETRLSHRSYQLQILNSILSQYGFTASDWQGTSYLVSNGKGSTEIAPHVSAVWSVIDGMSKESFDPLNKNFLKKIISLNSKNENE